MLLRSITRCRTSIMMFMTWLQEKEPQAYKEAFALVGFDDQVWEGIVTLEKVMSTIQRYTKSLSTRRVHISEMPFVINAILDELAGMVNNKDAEVLKNAIKKRFAHDLDVTKPPLMAAALDIRTKDVSFLADEDVEKLWSGIKEALLAKYGSVITSQVKTTKEQDSQVEIQTLSRLPSDSPSQSGATISELSTFATGIRPGKRVKGTRLRATTAEQVISDEIALFRSYDQFDQEKAQDVEASDPVAFLFSQRLRIPYLVQFAMPLFSIAVSQVETEQNNSQLSMLLVFEGML